MLSDGIELLVEQALTRAAALSDAGEHSQALQCLDAIGPAGMGMAQVHAARGWSLENLSAARLPEARSAYEAALELDSTDPWAQLGLAGVLSRLGFEEESTERLRSAMAAATPRTRTEPELLELVGWCQYRLGHCETARLTFEQALGIEPDWLSVRFDLALVLLVLGRGAEAGAHFNQALALLAEPGGAARRGVAMVALDDLDDALRRGPALPAVAAAVQRACLEQAIARCGSAEVAHGDE